MKRLHIFAILSILLLSLPAVFSFFHKGFMVSDDGSWMVIRLAAFYDAFKDGQFPVRWVDTLNFGYGYPVTNFLYPGFMYLALPLVVITSNFVLTIKLMFVLSILAGPLGFYLWVSRKYNLFSSIIGSLLYAYIPYHLFNTATRGSLGEIVFLAILPFIFWTIDTKRQLLLSVLLGLLLISHNTLAVMLLPVILLYIFLIKKSVYKSKKDILLPTFLGIGSSLFFWIPALTNLSDTRFSSVSVADYSGYFSSIALLGIPSLIIVLVSLYLFIRNKKRKYISIESLFLFIGLVSLLMASSLSSIIWSFLPVAFVQFPFRFLSLSIFSISFLATDLLSRTKYQKIIGPLLVIGTVLLGVQYLYPKGFEDFPDSYYTTNQATTTVKNEYMPKDVVTDPSKVPDVFASIMNGTVSVDTKVSNYMKFSVDAQEPSVLSVEHLYFPGWQSYVDGQKKDMTIKNDLGTMQIQIPEGRHTIELRFKETPIRLFADILSIWSVLLMIWFFVIRKYVKN